MPACLTHYCFAQRVREDREEKASLDLCAYTWGAQGPDFFFCHRFLPVWKGDSLREYGDRLHRATPSKVLGALRDFLKEHPDPVYRSYIEGFVCHYSLDCTAHPYINWLAGELAEDQIYSETKLAAMIGISRTPVKDALEKLRLNDAALSF